MLLYKLEAIASRLEAIAIRFEAVASRLEIIASRLEAIAIGLEAIARSEAISSILVKTICSLRLHARARAAVTEFHLRTMHCTLSTWAGMDGLTASKYVSETSP